MKLTTSRCRLVTYAGPRGCGHLDNRGDHRRDGHLSCLSHPGSSLSSSRPELVDHHVAYQGTRSAHQDPSVD